MKINSLLESQTTSSAISNTTTSAPKFGRDDEHLEEMTAGATGSGSVASVASPVGKVQSRGSIFSGIKTSEKFPNSTSVKETTFNRAGYNPLRDKADYLDKRDHLQQQLNLPGLSKEDRDYIRQRILDLEFAAKKAGLTESWLGDRSWQMKMNAVHDVRRTYGADLERDEFMEQLWNYLDQQYGPKVARAAMDDSDLLWMEYTDPMEGVAEGEVVQLRQKNPLTPNLIKQLKALSQQALELFWEGSGMPTAVQGQVAQLGKNEEQRMFKQNEANFRSLGYEYSINEESQDILYLHSIAREAWYEADKPANMYRGLPDLMYNAETNTLSYYDLIGDDGYEYTDTRQFEGVAEGEVKQFPKKHRGDLEDTHSCVKCGGDLQGGTYMGHKVKVCIPCKQVYLPPNTGIDQRGNKVNEQGVAEGSIYKKDQDLSSIPTQELEAFVKKHWGGGVPTYGQGKSVQRAMRELRRRQKQGVAEGLNEFAPPEGSNNDDRSRRLRKLLEIAIKVAEEQNVGTLGMVHAMNTIAGDDFFSVAVEGILPDITDKEYTFILQSAYKTVKQGNVEEGSMGDELAQMAMKMNPKALVRKDGVTLQEPPKREVPQPAPVDVEKLQQTYNQLKQKYEQLGGDSWQYADRMMPRDYEAQQVQQQMNNIARQISNAKKGQIDEAEISEEMLAHELYKDLQIFKKGADKDIGSKAKNKDLSDKPKDKEIIAKSKKVANEGKIKGADGKACWKGKRYAGTKNGKDICVPVSEEEGFEPEGETVKNSLHTIIRVATHLERQMGDNENLPEWVSEKIGAIKEMMVGVMDFEISDKEAKADIDEDWQKTNKHDKTDGMSPKAVKAYRRENPGSKLQTAVTTKPSKLKAGSKDAKRRKSFCARMSGNKGPMKDEKGRPTPKAKALRRWNCEE